MTRSADRSPWFLHTATETDIDAAVQVINAAYRVEDFFIEGDRSNASILRRKMNRPGECVLVVRGDGITTPGGITGAIHVRAAGEVGYFGMLSVDPACQKMGLGRFLVEAAEHHCRQAGCTRMVIDVVNLRTELPGFYQKLGYTTGDRVEFPDQDKVRADIGKEVYMTLMSRDLVAE